MNLRVIIPAAIAGLSTLGAALAEPGEWTTPRILRIVALAAVAALVVLHREAPALPSAPDPEKRP